MAGGGEIAAVFKSLAADAAKAGEDIGNSIAKFTEKTADIEEENVARTLVADAENAPALRAIKPNTGDLKGAGGSGAGDAAAGGAGGSGRNRISHLLNGDGAGPGSGSGLTDASRNDPAAADALSGRPTAGDPVDVATGDVVLSQADVTLAGVLPLVLERTHRSSHRSGKWLGPSWVSSFDQRLEVFGDRVLGAFADGRVLTWNLGADGPGGVDGSDGSGGSGGVDGSGAGGVLPEDGPCWPLRRLDDGAFTVTDPRRGLTWRFEPRSGHWSAGFRGGVCDLPLVSVTDRARHVIHYEYDQDGQPARVTHSGGYEASVTMTDGRIVEVAAGDVTLVAYEYDESGQLAGVINSSGQPLRFTYDADGRLAGWTDRNRQSYRYTFDSSGRCVRGESPSGALSGTFSYEPGITRWTDGVGAVTTCEIDAAAQLAAVIDPLGNVTRYVRDSRGRVFAEIDPLGRETRYAFDDFGNLLSVTRPDGETAAAAYDDRCQPVEVWEFGRGVWRQEFDVLGNRISLTQPDGAVTRWEYDDAGHLTAMTEPDGPVTRVACDAAGLPVSVAGPDGAVTRYERDRFGRIGRMVDPVGAQTSLTWSVEGRLLSRVSPDGSREAWEWDGEGNLVRHTSAAGAATAYEYGAFDKAVAAVWPDGTRTSFGYDHEQRVTSVVHAGLTWAYEYDAAGRLTAETDYNGALTRYLHDAAGQLVRRVNGAGQEINYSYDALGNVVSSVADGAEASFSYDAAGRLVRARNAAADVVIERDLLGRVTAETCNGRTLSVRYDAAGRVTERVTPSGAASAWSYDDAGRAAGVSLLGQELRFGYDASGREVNRSLPGGVTLRQEWDPVGRLAGQSLAGPGGVPRPGIPGAEVAGPEGPVLPGQPLQRRAYTYDPDGFVTQVSDLLTGSRAFGLDPSGRVTAVSGPEWAERYAYDPAGNVTGASWPAVPGELASGWLDAASQGPREVTGTLVRGAGSVSYRHDGAGRVVSRVRTRLSRKPETWRYTWDADDRLVSVVLPDGSTWRYSYDPLGRRTGKQHVAASGQALSETRFAWDGALLAEQSSVSSPGGTGEAEEITTWEYQRGSFAPVAQASHVSPVPPAELREAPQEEIDRRFYAIITDLAGTPSELVAATGSLAGYQQHTLWGGTVWHPSGSSTPLRFPGQYEDPETGLHYNNQRYYDPVTGAYLSPDPLGLTPAPNPHAYVSNPQIEADPLGLMGGDCKVTVYHYTSRENWNKIRGSGYRVKPGDAKHGPGPFVTNKSPAELTEPNAFKKLGITSDKSKYLISFLASRDSLLPIRGGRGKFIFSIPGGITIPKEDLLYSGPMEEWGN